MAFTISTRAFLVSAPDLIAFMVCLENRVGISKVLTQLRFSVDGLCLGITCVDKSRRHAVVERFFSELNFFTPDQKY